MTGAISLRLPSKSIALKALLKSRGDGFQHPSGSGHETCDGIVAVAVFTRRVFIRI